MCIFLLLCDLAASSSFIMTEAPVNQITHVSEALHSDGADLPSSAPPSDIAHAVLTHELTSPVLVERPEESHASLASPSPAAETDEKTMAELHPSSASISTPASQTSAGDEGVELIPVTVKKYTWIPPSDAASFPYQPHAGEGSQYLRDFILGVNDGLISTFLVVVGIVGGGGSTLQSLLVGISSAIAGALSMGIGEYIATKSQLQVSSSEMCLEKEHFKYHRDVELEQLRQFLASVNLSGNLLDAVVSQVGCSDEGLMKMMQAFEFGGEEELERNPLKAMWMSGRLFFLGSLPTVIPFFFTMLNSGEALGIAAGLVGLCLFIAGAYKTRTTKGNWIVDGMENLCMGAVGAGIAYAVGVIFNHAS